MKRHDVPLNIGSKALETFRTDFDAMLANTIFTMEQKDSDEAEITVKFTIKTVADTVPDDEATYPNTMRDIKKPFISHKIASKLTLKSERTGTTVRGDAELVRDKRLNCYLLRPLDDAQTSIFDFENYEYEAGEISEDTTND